MKKKKNWIKRRFQNLIAKYVQVFFITKILAFFVFFLSVTGTDLIMGCFVTYILL